jgi:hypothetical protein
MKWRVCYYLMPAPGAGLQEVYKDIKASLLEVNADGTLVFKNFDNDTKRESVIATFKQALWCMEDSIMPPEIPLARTAELMPRRNS